MCGEYIVYQNNCKVGNVIISENGLYYKIYAKCGPHTGEKLRLFLKTPSMIMDLGLIVPDGNSFVLNKSIPQKQLKEERPYFYLCTKNNAIPFCNTEPFEYLSELESLTLKIIDGKKCLVLRK